jgi:hypothetical protein
VSLDTLWDWGVSISAGKERPMLDVGSTLLNIVRNGSHPSDKMAWSKSVEKSTEMLEELLLTNETLNSNTKQAKAAVLELEISYVRLAARMPQERAASLLNHALFLHLVRQDVESAGNSYATALTENPGDLGARRGYEYYVNRGMLAVISPKQKKILNTLRRKKQKSKWRSKDTVTIEGRIAGHLSILLEAAASATAEYEGSEEEFLVSKKIAKNINKFRNKEEYTEEDKIQMKEYKRLKRVMAKKKVVMEATDAKVNKLRKQREERRVREGEL